MRSEKRPLDVPLTAPFRIATGEWTVARNVLVTVAQDGETGYGEAAPFQAITGGTQSSVLDELERLPSVFEADQQGDVEGILHRLGAQRLGCDARNALDVALHDWWARRRRVALAELLRGRVRDLPTSITLPLVEASALEGRVRAALEAGYSILKVKSRSGVEAEKRRIRLVRDVAGSGVEIRVDANAGWSRDEARALLPVLRQVEVAFVEQPLVRDDLEGHAELVRLGQVPIMLDESVFTLDDARRVLHRKAADLINVKLAKAGGILEAARILRFAEASGVDCMVGCMLETRVGISAAAHVAAAFPAVKYVDLDGHTFLARDPVEGGVWIERGLIRFPREPGHGAVPTEVASTPAT